jgi:hypothetical protein
MRKIRSVRSRASAAPAFVAAVLLTTLIPAATAQQEPLDHAHNVPIPCELVSTPGSVPRSAKNIAHLANVCGFVGTDIEFQSRVDANGKVHDYAFVGTMGAGTRIFDVSNPATPTFAGGYLDPGWQNDVQVRGDLLVIGFDWLVVGADVSACLKAKGLARGSVEEAGVDIVRLEFDPVTATFDTQLVDCYLSSVPTGGAHTTTIHPSGDWLTIDTAFAGLEVVDIRGSEPRLVHVVPRAVVDQAHDVFFSRDGNTLYSAGISSTRIVDVSDVFNRAPTLIKTIPNSPSPDGHTLEISHQSDVSADGTILAITDERGGGLDNTDCNANANGIIGAMHFWAVGEAADVPATSGATPTNPKKIGTWRYPNPTLAPDPLQDVLPRAERACTIHVFRHGGNGSSSPGPSHPEFDGVSTLPIRQTATAHYGAGVWHIDFSRPPTSSDGTAEDPQTTWGNTLGWNVMPGADTWSAKEYKGFIYTGDMGRGFDVYRFTPGCEGPTCIVTPNTPGKAWGGGQIEGQLAELSILEGTSAGGRANFGFNAQFENGLLSGHLTFIDRGAKKKVESTSITSFTQAGNTATFTGPAKVNGAPGFAFTVKDSDGGDPGSGLSNPDTFSLFVSDAYVANGVLLKGNIQVHD